MKKTLLLIALVLCCATTIFAQNNKISYQAVVRDTENKLVANKDVEVTVNIYNGPETATSDAVYTETQTVTTNLNGLISLMIGPDVATPAWNSIQWNQARIETTVTLDNTSLGTLKMPLTAVPYALYAKEISPDAVVVTEIYNKMFVDSNALAGQITNLDSKLTSKIHEDSVALAGQITTLNTNLTSKIYEDSVALAGQITNLDSKLTSKIYEDSVALAGQITTLNTNLTNEINNLKAADNALSTRIANDSANLKNNYYTKTETNTLFNQYCESECITALKNRITELENQLANIISQFSPVVTTANVSSIAATTASCGGNVTNDGGKPVTARGVCWSTSENPTTSNSKTTNGTGTGSFTSSLSNLNPNTSYNVRAYATNCVGTAYGEDKTFTTLATINTSDVSNVTKNSAKCGGSFPTTNGSAAITERGVCWSTSQNPTLGTNNYTSNGTGTSSFTSDITGLSQGTTYYVRAYAKNAGGTAYGEQKTFTTPTVPTVTTTAASNITDTSAISGGNVTNDGGATVTARGVCWSTSENPTVSNSKTTNGTGTGSFTSSLSNLTPNTIYYVRAYATNSAGTAYGDQKTFTTTSSVEENSSFAYCYDCQRDYNNPYPKANESATISGFSDPLVDLQGVTGFNHTTPSDGPWKVEYVGVYSSTNQYGFTDSQINYLKGKYGMSSTASVPIFLLKKRINGQYVGLVYGVVCAYSKTTNNIDHTALFIAPRENNNEGWGFFLTGNYHSSTSSITVTFDQDVSGGLNDLINQ